jgi:hypothetical protein
MISTDIKGDWKKPVTYFLLILRFFRRICGLKIRQCRMKRVKIETLSQAEQ